MARITGPLHSDSASGKFGKAIVYSVWKGIAYARSLVTPANPKSVKQVGCRSMFGFCSSAWAAISALNQATWDAMGTAIGASGFNAYVKYNLARWQTFNGPTQANPAAEASSGLTITTQTLTGGVGECTLEITPSGGTSIWGFMIFRSTSEIVTPSWANCVAVIAADGANAVTHVDSPLDAGTYHYRVAAFNVDGTMGTIHADGSATVS